MSEARRVRHLHLRGPERAGLVRATHLVEDAMATASLPAGRPGWLLLIRHLDLGRVATDRPSQVLSEIVATRVQDIVRGAVHADSPGARQANAVWFHDVPQARAALAVRLVQGPAPTEWYWTAAAPMLPRSGAVTVATLRAICTPPPAISAAELPAPLWVARLLTHLLTREAAEPVLLALGPDAPWVAALRPAPVAVSTAEPTSLAVSIAAPAPWRPLLAVLARVWGLEAPATVALAVAAVLAAAPELASSPRLPVLAEAVRRAAVARPVARPRSVEPPASVPFYDRLTPPEAPAAASSPQIRPLVSRDEAAPAPAPPLPVAARPPAAAPVPGVPTRASDTPPVPPSEAPPPARGAAPLVAATPPAPASPPSAPTPRRVLQNPRWLVAHARDPVREDLLWPAGLEGREVSDCGGLVFLVHVLARVGLPRLLEAQPEMLECALPWRIFGELLQRVEAPDDPVLSALAPRFEPAPPPEDLTRSWADQVSAWVETRTQAPLSTLVRRPAILAWTPTHLDLVLPLSALSLAARRLALDANPGWVHWLGRIIEIRYVENDEFANAVRQIALEQA